MKKNESGFSLIVLLVVVIICLVGAVGWLVGTRQNSVTKDISKLGQENEDNDNSANEPEETTDETANWASFTPNSKLYTVKLPDGWTFMHQNDDCDCIFAETTVYRPGTPATVGKTQGGRDGISGYFIAMDDSDLSDQRFRSFKKQGTFKAGDLVGTKYYYEQTTEPEGIGLEKGGKQYAYYFIKKGQGIYISYSINPGTANHLELVEKSIKTLR
jgi:hypothetical protein